MPIVSASRMELTMGRSVRLRVPAAGRKIFAAALRKSAATYRLPLESKARAS